MPYHVELRAPRHRAWLFNLEPGALQRGVLAPWGAGTPFEAGGQRWEPRDTSLRILDGPHLDPPDLAHGQGWNTALKRGRDVTRELLAARAPRVAVVAAGAGERERGLALVAALGLEAGEWEPARAALLAGAPPGVDIAFVMVGARPGGWLFDAGLAVAALGERALLVAGADDAPAELGGIAVAPADAGVLARAGLKRSTTPAGS